MKIVMVGEAATHQQELAEYLVMPAQFTALPREAHESTEWDAQIDHADVLISMRFQRPSPGPRFRLMHLPGAGLDGVDFSVLPATCQVCNVYEHEIPMAEYAMACLLEHQVGLAGAGAAFRSDSFGQAYLARQPHGELYGKTLMVVGFGRIGQAIAIRAKAMGLRVIAISGRARDGRVEGPMDEAYTDAHMLEQLPRADFVVLCCPLNDQTRNAFGAHQLAAMRPNAVLINIARAGVVDQGALFDALKAGRIGRAFLDVWYRYPAGDGDKVAPADFPFETLPNALCTPHISGWTEGLFARRYKFIAENINRLFKGEPLLNSVSGRV